MKRVLFSTLLAVAVGVVAGLSGRAAPPACDPDNGGITLPDGFCAKVVADTLGAARHLVVAPNGDLFVSLQNRRGATAGVVALRDSDGDGKMDVSERFGDASTTGIALRNGYLYTATTTSVVRFKMNAGELKPAGAGEIVVDGLPAARQHQDKGIAFDGRGGMYVNVGAPSNACQEQDRRAKSPGQDPCPLLEKHGGIWRFDENKPGQKQEDGKRYSTGMRQMVGLTWHDGSLYVVMHGRDQLDTMWPELFTHEQNAELPSETMMRVTDGANFGWPYCYHDWQQNKLIQAPEFGGDGKKADRCGSFSLPIVAFPGHWAPNDVLFYTGTQFPKKYQGGAFIAFHGSWNRAPLPQKGYSIVYVPFNGGKPGPMGSGAAPYEVFADGFAGKTPLQFPNDAVARPGGLAVGPDGSLYVADDQKGRVWRIMYRPH
jgi:glucose/arabinose dehydrogenase